MQASGFGSRVSGFGFRVSGFGFWVSGFGFRVSGFGCEFNLFGGILICRAGLAGGSGFMVLGFDGSRFRILWVWGLGFRMYGSGF